MVTYSDLIQTGILIIGLIDLVLRLIEADRNKKTRGDYRLSGSTLSMFSIQQAGRNVKQPVLIENPPSRTGGGIAVYSFRALT